ncbi:twin transmembrane helix small protein [Sphingobium cloacae]|uniref:twin transmembrane helix small protein n=1 Tax=Sphingobium cloacae TaxID=120107 RepID=UPI0008339C85|nr:twin transmembrane helix small protein [Sphingobium cloacae]
MNTLLVIALILAMAATLFALIRGIVAFLQATKEELNSPDGHPSQSSLKQNRMMMNRILFQAAAVIIVALLLLMKGSG